mmetsp:Transcript_17632/g.30883  ORF Transcript_17632/g.30883 Transcript_17632/m.30883 type:complete len:202 (-) Transcript_17632:343-948(-)
MALRADAKAFEPAVALTTAPQVNRGDQLIQQLAKAMAMAPAVPKMQKQRCLQSSGLFCPCCRDGFACAFHQPLPAAPHRRSVVAEAAMTKPRADWPASTEQIIGKLTHSRSSGAKPGARSCRSIQPPPGLEYLAHQDFTAELEDWTDASTSESPWTERSAASGTCCASTGVSPCKPSPHEAKACGTSNFIGRSSRRELAAR